MNIKQKIRLLKWRINIYPGHYYSPIPSVRGLIGRREIFKRDIKEVPGIELRYTQQMELCESFKKYYEKGTPFLERGGLRYHFENNMYSYADALFYYFMLLHVKPKRVIEAGSGFTSALLLDVNEKYFDSSIECTFIEPYSKRLRSILRTSDRPCIIEKNLQDIELEFFESLEPGDILFIDSTHIVKTGSDVNYIFAQILPSLKEGIYIHFHDVFYPFEYPEDWILTGRAWNEDYMLRSFLQYNDSFQIELWNNYLITQNREWFAQYMPLCLKNTGGSIWIRKIKK